MTGKRIAIVGLLLPVIVLPGVFFIFLKTIDFNNYKPLIQEQVEEFSGRILSIDGDIELDIGFTSRLAVNNVNLSNAPWGSRETMISIKRAEAEVTLLPLLFGNIHIDRLILIEPDILLETDTSGNGNWHFYADNSNDKNKNQEHQNSSLTQINHVLITNVNINYRDGASGEETHLSLESIEANTRSPGGVLNAQIIGSINKQPIKLINAISL